MNIVPLILACVAVMAGGFVQASTGFGLALVSVPPLLLLLDQSVAIPTLVVMGLVSASVLLYHRREHTSFRIVLPLIGGALPGVLTGYYFLTTVEGPLFKVAVGIFIVAVAGIMLGGWRHPVKNEGLALVPVGTTSGFLHGSIALSGPPVILFLTNAGTSRDVFRGSLAAYFMLLNLMTLCVFASQGLITGEVFTRVGILLPVMLIGTFVGIWSAKRIPEVLFRKLTLLLAGSMGVMLLVMNLIKLMPTFFG